MWLSGNPKTGEKIMKNFSRFSFKYVGNDESSNEVLYRFTWNFDGRQHGYISVAVRKEDNKISNSSLIDTDINSNHPFGRPLGFYNDSSLESVFVELLKEIKVTVN